MKLLRKILLLSSMASLTPAVAMAEGETATTPDCTVYIAPFTIEQGTTLNVPVLMDDGDLEAIQFQCDIYLPEGLATEYSAADTPAGTVNPERVTDHTLSSNALNGFNRYAIISMTNSEIKGGDGAVFFFPIIAEGEPGEYTITIKNARVAYPTVDSYAEVLCPVTTTTVTIVEPEVKRYGENQIYCKDLTADFGTTAQLLIGYNSTSEVYDYEASISLPEGVSVSDVAFQDCVNVSKYTNDWSFSDGVLTLSGSEGKRGDRAAAGDNIFAIATIEIPDDYAIGSYPITVAGQTLTNYDEENDGEYTPDDYVAYLTVTDPATGVETNIASPAETLVEIYDLNGVRVHTGKAADGRIELPAALNRSQIYIVKIGGRTLKCRF